MSTSNDSNDTMNHGEGGGPAKRHAKKGQWQTPPVGQFFPSAAATAAISTNAIATSNNMNMNNNNNNNNN
eukprot:CAMPEP_0203669586 /NCGR_PEP_ID=MMETSP0090-20130426/5906_1 /ASSEMBLY_ACC=CAM_ASM_001088 /TAXON_ID=426623 /ORGANISM="Chaetoceros affinis, Strain CCMP159" /LENGTH=69 /DNA_ID=CAMNT_0050534295 /DNA_START=61 /DNA_END=267 /DNA_ORIENTATION=-